MPTTEHTINDVLADLLRESRKVWRASGVVSSENTEMLKGSSKRPDIVVLEPNVSPVIIETEVAPAGNVEMDARVRLGEQVRKTGRIILSSVAVRLPERFRTKSGSALRAEVVSAQDLEVALYTGSNPDSAQRWPSSGWLRGNVTDLSILTQSASVPPDVIERATDDLVDGVREAAGLIQEMADSHPGAIKKICEELRQHDDEQTRRMAATILANAFVFQNTLAGGPGKLATVESIEELRSTERLNQSEVINQWRHILDVNYWPIFDIACRILKSVPSSHSTTLIDRMARTAEKLVQKSLMRSHDLTGAVFQRLIVDRKFLAAYYTTPASAALLVGLVITPDSMLNGHWADTKKLTNLAIADFACGTGTLLSTAYQRLGQLHEAAGGDSEAIHADMMAHALIGCDVLPAAAHLTASMISGAHPAKTYEESSILTVAFGKKSDGSISLGSLDLLDPQKPLEVLAVTAHAVGAKGEIAKDTTFELPDSLCDLVVMNPPFVRATGQEAKKKGVPNPMFAAFGTSKLAQKEMSKVASKLTKGTIADQNAGEASIFLALADRKVKPNGTLALVMPLSLLSGESWERARKMLSSNYTDFVLVSISAAIDNEMSFSADTDMGECLMVCRKAPPQDERRATFVILKHRPTYQLEGMTAAREIRQLISNGKLRQLEDGPVGGTPLYFGDDLIGYAMDAPLPESGPWNPTRISDLSLAQTAHELQNGRIWLPLMQEKEAVLIPITNIGTIGTIGPYHMDVCADTASGGVRGPFERVEIDPEGAPTYPILWEHDAERERRLVFEADCEGVPRAEPKIKKKVTKGKGKKKSKTVAEKVAAVSKTASHCHFNENFRFNSQSTAMQFTTRRTIGGRAWKAIKLDSAAQEKALVLWGNTSIGLLLHWYNANKEHSGRGSIGIIPLKKLPVLDVTKLSKEQMAAAETLFDEFATKELRPINEAHSDIARKELDQRFATDVLGLPTSFTAVGGPLELLRMKLAHEPSIKGSKKTTKSQKKKPSKLKAASKAKALPAHIETSDEPEEPDGQEPFQFTFDNPDDVS